MKKFIALLMVGGLLLTGCGQQTPAPEQKEDVATVVEETPTDETEQEQDEITNEDVGDVDDILGGGNNDNEQQETNENTEE